MGLQNSVHTGTKMRTELKLIGRHKKVERRSSSSQRMLKSTSMLLKTLLGSQNPWEKRLALSKAITLIESRTRVEEGDDLLTALEERHEKSFRIGIAGSPGAGKSTFLEFFGKYLLETEKVKSLAVLCVDPSSPNSGGSILGDKTRMAGLARDQRCFVRASASQCALGGLAPSTESVSRLVSALHEIVFIETVGLGQSEVDVSQVSDVMVYLTAPHGGDDLQAVKKGILETADVILVTKADASDAAKRTAAEFHNAQGVLGKAARPVLLTSAVTGYGMPAVWQAIQDLRDNAFSRRSRQYQFWMKRYLRDGIMERIDSSRSMEVSSSDVERLPPRVAARKLANNIVIKE